MSFFNDAGDFFNDSAEWFNRGIEFDANIIGTLYSDARSIVSTVGKTGLNLLNNLSDLLPYILIAGSVIAVVVLIKK